MESRLPQTDLVEALRCVTQHPAAASDLRLRREAVRLSRQIRRAAASPAADTFIPSPLQARILEALDGEARRTDSLAAAVKVDAAQLFRAGGLPELRQRGLVRNNSKVGFYRPDAPPPAFSLPRRADKK